MCKEFWWGNVPIATWKTQMEERT